MKRPTKQLLSFAAGALLLLAMAWWVWRSQSADTAAERALRAETEPSGARQVVAHAQGSTEVTRPLQRVVALDLAALDTLDALGVPVVGVAGKVFPPYLSRYGAAPVRTVGTLFEPDYEALHALAPDLIVTGGRSSAKYPELAAHFPTIDLVVEADDPLRSTYDNARTLAQLFDKQEQVESIIQAIDAKVRALRTQTADRGKGLVILATGGRLSAYGPGSRFGLVHDAFGVPPAAEGLTVSRHGEAIRAEFLLEKNPSWLFVIDRDSAIGEQGNAKAVLDNPLVHRTAAWQKNQVIYLDPVHWYLVSGGLQALQKMVEEFQAAYAP